MIQKRGDLWTDSKAAYKLFTGNSYLRKDGALVMGRGCAAQALARYPGINFELGALIAQKGQNYRVLWSRQYPTIGVFQVKYHFRDDAEISLIEMSAHRLRGICERLHLCTFAMNMPGIGYGRLHIDQVLPIMKALPDNLEVWEYPE